jgi:outer membrane protein
VVSASLVLILVGHATGVGAQTPEESPLTLPELLVVVGSTDPGVGAANRERDRATAGVDLAGSAWLPRLQALAQINRATTNNVFGMLLPQSTIPAISGPPAADARSTSVWGSAAGALLTWDAVDFGRRAAQARAATSHVEVAAAIVEGTRLQRQLAAGEAFLTLLAADARVRTATAGVDRARTLQQVVDAQVAAEIRPGADANRARAELARTEVLLEDARLDASRARIAVAALAGRDVEALRVAGGLESRIPDGSPIAALTRPHPHLVEWQARARAAAARRDAEARGMLPTLSLSGAVYGRGSGALADGTLRGGSAGLTPDFPNWGVGVTIAAPLLDFKAVRARTAAAAAELAIAQERGDDVARDLAIRQASASAEVAHARKVADLLLPQLDAARTTERQVLTRYRVGLATIADVADAQRLLAQTESDAAVARLAVWLALLHAAEASGDLSTFLAAVQ